MVHSKDTVTSTVEVEGNPREVPQIDVLGKPEDPVAPDQFDEKYRTSRMEIWAYYTCVLSLIEAGT